MNIALSRRSGIPVKDQLSKQLELKILGGEIVSGSKLPSVRALARRLRVHPNTVSEAYQALQTAGHVLLHRGAGVYVRGLGPQSLAEARDLDEMIRLALDTALRRGYDGPRIRVAVQRWLGAGPPERILAVDPSAEMAELLVHEIHSRVGHTARACTIEDLRSEPRSGDATLIVCVPYHVEKVRSLVPGALVETVTLEVTPEDQGEIRALRQGAIVLVVSHSGTVLPFAEVLVKSLRGADIHVETFRLSEQASWRRVAPVADLVFADALAARQVLEARPKKLKEFRMVDEAAFARIRRALTAAVPRVGPA